MDAAGNGKVVINLSTGLEDPERATAAFLVGGAAVEQGKQVVMFLTKEASGSRCPESPRQLRAMAVRRSRGCSSSTRKAVRSRWCVRSASAPASSTTVSSAATRGWPAPRRCGSGSARARPCSATDRVGRPLDQEGWER